MMINKVWDEFLELDKIKKEEWFKNIINFIEYIYKTNEKICPNEFNIFKMFRLLSPYEIKVFMMFQDPYPQLRKGECVADGIGLAASYLTPSLKHFHRAIREDYKDEEIDITMMNLILQGVFSINKYLTVSRKPLSHSRYNATYKGHPVRYDLFMQHVLKKLNENFKHIVYIFFGKEAAELSSVINQDDNLVIETSHPSPRGYKYGLFDSNFAQKTNEYLLKHNKNEILW